MMHILPCDRVREDLAAFVDDELPMDARVLVHGHLQECVACRLEAAAIADLGDALRTMAGAVPGRGNTDGHRIITGVLEQVRVERQLSFSSRARGLFEDMHLVWAGLGASAAMVFCIFASAGVLQAASEERLDSLAGIISTIASADSGDSMRLADSTLENRALLDSTAAIQTTDADTDLMLSALITRDGRIQNLEILEQQARASHAKPEVVAMLDAASRARFERSNGGSGTAGVSALPVNVVWLVMATTVKGRPDYDRYLVSPPPGTPPVVTSAPLTRAPRRSSPVGRVPADSDNGLIAG
jgi:hypothetical protein